MLLFGSEIGLARVLLGGGHANQVASLEGPVILRGDKLVAVASLGDLDAAQEVVRRVRAQRVDAEPDPRADPSGAFPAVAEMNGDHVGGMQSVPERVSPKNARNGCTLFAPRTTVERETTTPRTNDARKAFDDLFKF